MMKMTDVALMGEHLALHEGIIQRLKHSMTHIEDQSLKKVAEEQVEIMVDHVKKMARFLDEEKAEEISLSAKVSEENHSILTDRAIALDGLFTAKAMSKENFAHSSLMKNPDVKKAHVDMALQQKDIAEKFEKIVKTNKWAYHPDAPEKTPADIVEHFVKQTSK